MSENDATERAVYDALRSLGWVVPQGEAEVAADMALEASGSLPMPPLPQSASDRLSSAVSLGIEKAGTAETTLARAAREGGRLTPEIEQAMRRDRQAAEAELDEKPFQNLLGSRRGLAGSDARSDEE